MKRYQYLYDPSFYTVIVINIFLIIEYRKNPDSIHSIVAFFWIQNIMIGLYNFLEILTAKKIKKGSYPVKESKGCSAFFFLFHYGAFQLGYVFFLGLFLKLNLIDWQYIKIAFWLLLAGMLINFARSKITMQQIEINLRTLFFLPYLRIVPMHLMILIPAFFAISSFTVFLVLKTIFDILMHIITARMMMKNDEVELAN